MLQVESRPKFPASRVVITDDVTQTLSVEDIAIGLARHLRGDWGELEAPSRQANEAALLQGGRLVSFYCSRKGLHFWIITEPDRSKTTVIRPDD